MIIFCSAFGEELFTDDEECGSETNLDTSNIRLVFDSPVSGHCFSGFEDILFNMELPKSQQDRETCTGFL